MISNLYAPLADADRLARIATYDLLHPDLRERLDAACAETCRRLGWPTANVTVVLHTAQYIAGTHGRPEPPTPQAAVLDRITPIEWSMCAYAVLGGRAYRVRDVKRHPAHRDNAALARQGVGSYAGVPLTITGGELIGAHCVVDEAPHDIGAEGLAVLSEAGRAIERLFAAYRM